VDPFEGGHRTALVERKIVGGSCPNVACLPSKNIIHSAKVASLAARAAEPGKLICDGLLHLWHVIRVLFNPGRQWHRLIHISSPEGRFNRVYDDPDYLN
jgi:hypothetical protein